MIRIQLQRKTLLLTIGVVVSVAVVLLGLFVILPFCYYHFNKPHFSLENKVESFVIYYENGMNVTVNPQSTEGEKLLSGCEAYMSNINGHLLLWLDHEGLTKVRNSTEHVEIKLKEVFNFTFFDRTSASEQTPSANRIFLFIGDGYAEVFFTEIENEEMVWHGAYMTDNGIAEFRNIVSAFSESAQ